MLTDCRPELQKQLNKPLNCKLLPDTERVMKGLSSMKGNFHVPFLEEGERVIALLYSAIYIQKN